MHTITNRVCSRFSISMLKRACSLAACSACIALAIIGIHITCAYASDSFTSNQYGWGDDYLLQEKARAAPKALKPPSEAQSVTMGKLKKDLPSLFENAFNNPNHKNTVEYYAAQQVLFDKAYRLSQAFDEIATSEPLLNRNSVVPIRSLGAQSLEMVAKESKAAAVRYLAQKSGLYIFVDSLCETCAIQLNELAHLRAAGMQYMVISLDGKMPKGFEKVPFVVDNGMFRKFNLKVTPAMVMVYDPQAVKIHNGVDNNYYSVIAHGFYSYDDLEKQMAFAGLKRKMLPPQIARGLDVWNRGVASNEDLQMLKVTGMSYEQAYKPLVEKALARDGLLVGNGAIGGPAR